MTYKTLASMDFNGMLFEAQAQTKTGQELLNKYQSYVMANPVTCGVVNNFLKEAAQLSYDNGINSVLDKVSKVVTENKYSWAIASTCENINNNGTAYNFLAMNAAKQAEQLLEMKEEDVVSYIKAGALRNVQHVPQFRAIAKAVFQEHPVYEEYSNFSTMHPVSLVENNNDNLYFEVAGNLYKIDVDGKVNEALWSEVSNDFKMIAQFLESDKVIYEDQTLTYNGGNYSIMVKEQGKCVKTMNDKKFELTTEQLREQNNMYLSNIHPSAHARQQYDMEMMAKVVENFDRIAVLDNTYIVTTNHDRFMLIENNENAFAKLLASNRTAQWATSGNIYETVEFVKGKTKADLTEMFKTKIDNVIGKAEAEKKEQIKESLMQDEIATRRTKIEKLIEENKNNPTMLAVLSKAAFELSTIE